MTHEKQRSNGRAATASRRSGFRPGTANPGRPDRTKTGNRTTGGPENLLAIACDFSWRTDRAHRISEVTTYRPERQDAANRLLRANLADRLHAINCHHEDRECLSGLLKRRAPLADWAISLPGTDDEPVWYELVGEPVRDGKTFAGYRGIARDVTVQVARNRIVSDVMDHLPDAVAAYDRDDELVLFNAAYRELYDVSAPAIQLGASFAEIIRYGLEHGQYPEAGFDKAERERWFEERLKAHRAADQIVVQRLPDGRWLQIRERRSAAGNIVGIRTDITEQKRHQTTLQRVAERDALTGIANRVCLFQSLAGVFADRHKRDSKHAFLLLDLDHFKSINDTLGHDAGDVLLIEVASRLKSTIRSHDIAARLGGDEFAVVLCDVSGQDEVGRAVTRLSHTLAEPITIAGQLVQPKASVGIAIGTPGDNSPEQLWKRADTALYQAKQRGRGRWLFYDSALEEDHKLSLSIANELREGLITDQLVLVFQPQVHLTTGRIAGFEALVRWQRDGRLRSPAEFLGVARRHGMIVEVGRTVLRKALGTVRQLLDQELDPGMLSVNIDADQLKSQGFHGELVQLLSLYGLEASRLECEITEDVAVDRGSGQIVEAIEQLSKLGASIALDDFGTGYASLTHLKRLHAQTIKIDRSFVFELPGDKETAVITQALVNMSQSLGVKVIAEGIETQEQLDCLRAMDCDIGQGYLFAKPMPYDQMVAFIRDWKAPV